jgi:hypothetical protein
MSPGAFCGELEEDYYTAVSMYFQVSRDTIVDLVKLEIPDVDIPVTIFIAQENTVAPHRIAEVRIKGDSWMDIIRGRGMSPEVFYFLLVGEFDSKTYSPIFAKFDTTARSQWKHLILTDGEIQDMVNLKFIYRHYDYSVFEVMAFRDNGRDMVAINSIIAAKKEELLKEEKRRMQEEAKAKDKEGE